MIRHRRHLAMLFGTLLIVGPAPAMGGTGPGDTGIVEILFESSAPYYEPQLAVVSAGMPVRWSNATASPHSIRHDECLKEDGQCVFRSLAVPPENSFAIAPLPPGRYSYHCELHPVMRGTLVVVESQAANEESEPLAPPGK
ncbi:MAG: Putative Blue (Type 1) copper protein, cupredoxin family (modular protein) [Nitrospira sp.]